MVFKTTKELSDYLKKGGYDGLDYNLRKPTLIKMNNLCKRYNKHKNITPKIMNDFICIWEEGIYCVDRIPELVNYIWLEEKLGINL